MLDNQPFLEAIINHAAAGDNTIIAAVPGKAIRVYRLFLVCDADMLLTFKDGAAIALSGAMEMKESGAIVFDITDGGTPQPWFTTTVGNAFVINTTGGTGIRGRCYYTVAAP